MVATGSDDTGTDGSGAEGSGAEGSGAEGVDGADSRGGTSRGGTGRGGGDGGFSTAVESVLASLQSGDVVTYGEVAAEAGHPGAARAVGRLLATSGGKHPWWRVVAASGRLAPGKERDQASHLADEGVVVVDGRVVGMGRRGGRGRREPDRRAGR